ncbi:MAG: hypothetical protein HKP41_18125 [Desulfobacterales bacterium]|nr:hypothetical protein [Deltaproteobacteria bacterium]NNK96271.1 hypothetical protein [Desulfobacterales bacterium]
MKKRLLVLLYISILGLLTNCAGSANYGTVKRDTSVTEKFKSFEINQSYSYFYFGKDERPFSIMGIDSSYTVESKFWYPIDLSKEQLQRWIIAFEATPVYQTGSGAAKASYHGSVILNPQGEPAGVIYSMLHWIVITFPGDKVVAPFPPSYPPGDDPSTKYKGDR